MTNENKAKQTNHLWGRWLFSVHREVIYTDGRITN